MVNAFAPLMPGVTRVCTPDAADPLWPGSIVAKSRDQAMSAPAVVKFDMSKSSWVDPNGIELDKLIASTYQAVAGYRDPIPLEGDDGKTIVFESALQAEMFGELLHKRSFLEHNAVAREEQHCWSFRVGIATGNIHKDHTGKWTGYGYVTAARLEAALDESGTGQILIDPNTFAALPPERRAEYGEAEKLKGKEHDPGLLEGHRRRVVPPAPWHQRWDGVSSDLKREFNVALGALEQVKLRLHSLFRGGVLTDPDSKRLLTERQDMKPRGSAHYEIWNALKNSLRGRSTCPCWDVQDPSVSIDTFAKSPDPRVWMIDSLDGSRNVAHMFPFYATTMALVDASSQEPLIGLTYIPWSRESFFAIRNGGAYHNDWDKSSRLKVSDRSLASSLVYLEFPNAD